MKQTETELIKIIESLENYEEATDALIELKNINKDKTKTLSKEILYNKRGDVYFQAFAFHILYSISSTEAINFAKINLSTLPVYLLGAVVEQATEESGIIDEDEELKRFVTDLKSFLQTRKESDLTPIKESLDWFYETYGK